MGIPQPNWTTVNYSKKQIEKAGKQITEFDDNSYEYNEAVKIVNNWRETHAYPLYYIFKYLKKISSNDNYCIVAERLKRLDSIIEKMKRFPDMSLSRMQDLGGCRLITKSVEKVYEYSEKCKNSSIKHELKNEFDYIKQPKNSGYRGVHLIYKYHSEKSEYDGMLIEIQIRTHLQHIWATAVETMGIYLNQNLKAGQGSKDINRFFALISSLFAYIEQQPLVPGTPNDIDEIIHEIESLNAQYNYLGFLDAVQVITDMQGSNKDDESYFLLCLEHKLNKLVISKYQPSEVDEANEKYHSLELNSDNNVVLVRATSFEALKKAYPNYFSNIHNFIEIIKYCLQNDINNIYTNLKECLIMKRNFTDWLSKFHKSIANYGYYIDFDKVYRNVNDIKVELNILNSLIGSTDIENDFKSIITKYPETLKCLPILLAVRANEIYAIDGDGEFSYDFKKANYSPEQYAVFMRKTGLFELLENHIIHTLVDYVTGVETGLDSNGRKNRGGHLMEDLVESFIVKAGFVKGKTYFKEMYIHEITELWDIDLSAISNSGKAEKRFDFVIKTDKCIYGIETNFYASGGSKLNETARSYKQIAQEVATINGFEFVWFTDGSGWTSARHNLEETFDVMEHIYSIDDLEKGILSELL